MPYNGKLFVVVADFEERQRPAGRDGKKEAETTHTTDTAMQ